MVFFALGGGAIGAVIAGASLVWLVSALLLYAAAALNMKTSTTWALVAEHEEGRIQ